MVRISRVREYTNELCLHHSHPELEINVFLGGTGTYWVNGVRYPVRSGDVFLFLGDMFHSLAIENERAGVDLIKVIFSLGEIGQYGSDELYTGLVEAVYPGDEKLNVRIPGGVKHAAAILRAAELLVQNRVDMLSADGEKFLLLYILNTAKEYHAAHGRTGSGAFNAAVYGVIGSSAACNALREPCGLQKGNPEESGSGHCRNGNGYRRRRSGRGGLRRCQAEVPDL